MYLIVDPNQGIFALCVLPYLLRDTRHKPDHEKMMIFCSVSTMTAGEIVKFMIICDPHRKNVILGRLSLTRGRASRSLL